MWGIPLEELKKSFGDTYYDYVQKMAKKHLNVGNLILKDNRLKLTQKGIFISDGIMSDLLYVEA